MTTSNLINNIKIRGSFPSSDDLFSTSDFLSLLDDEMMNVVVPLISRINEEYFLVYNDQSIVSGTSAYRIPKRAIGSALRDVKIIDSSGNITHLSRLFEEDQISTTQGYQGYYLKGNQIILSPQPTTSNDTLRMVYVRRPNKFVATSSCAEISSIDVGLNQVVVGSVPATMTTNTLIDFIQGDSPYDLLEMDQSITGVSGTTISFSSLPDDLAVGDYISLASETCVPMVPEELIPILVQATLCVCLASKKDKSVDLELQKLEQMKKSIIDLLSPRVKSDDKKIRSTFINYFR